MYKAGWPWWARRSCTTDEPSSQSNATGRIPDLPEYLFWGCTSFLAEWWMACVCKRSTLLRTMLHQVGITLAVPGLCMQVGLLEGMILETIGRPRAQSELTGDIAIGAVQRCFIW